MLSIANAAVGYPRRLVARDVALEVGRGEVCALVAPNGAGKTTLLKALSGRRQTLRSGIVLADGVPSGRFRDFARKVCYASPDAPNLVSNLTLHDHLETIAELWRSDASAERIAERLGTTGMLDEQIGKMSQGMRQIASLGCALATGADYLLLDEPLNGLDPLRASEAACLFAELAHEGRGLIVSSHIFAGLEDVATSLAFLTPGGIRLHPPDSDWRRLFAQTYERQDRPKSGSEPPRHAAKHWK